MGFILENAMKEKKEMLVDLGYLSDETDKKSGEIAGIWNRKD